MRSGPLPPRLAAAGFDLGSLASSSAVMVPVAGVLGVVTGVAVVAKPSLVLAMLALGLALIGVAVALVRPGLAFGGLVALLALIPTYASPSVSGVLFIPAAGAGWAIGAALLWRDFAVEGYRFRPSYVDYAALLFFGLMLLSTAYSPRGTFDEYVHSVFIWAGPWLGARMLLAHVETPVKVVALSFAALTIVLAPIALAESLGGSNPFYNLNFNSAEFGIWASQIDRFGETRAVTSFGHPIAFSMFLACSALLSVAMGIATEKSKPRWGWYCAAAVAIGTMALALSRTGWVMLAVGLIALAVVTVRGPIRKRLLTLFVIVIGVVLVTSVVMPNEISVLPGLGNKTEANYASSGLYREKLLERALQPGVLDLWGNAQNMVTSAVQFGTATDNAYIILADRWGLIPTFALFGLAAALIVAALRSHGIAGEPQAILPIVAFTCLVAIFFVAFITQQQSMIWLLIGAAGASAERVNRIRREARSAARERTRRAVVRVLPPTVGSHRHDQA